MGDIGLLSAQTVGELIHQKFESPLPKTQEGEDPLINGKSDQIRVQLSWQFIYFLKHEENLWIKSSWTLSATKLSCCSFMHFFVWYFSFLMIFKKSTCINSTHYGQLYLFFVFLKERWGFTEVKNWHSSRSRTALIRQFCLYKHCLKSYFFRLAVSKCSVIY